MTLNLKLLAKLGLACCLAWAVAGCSSKEETPEEAIYGFMEVACKGDVEGLNALNYKKQAWYSNDTSDAKQAIKLIGPSCSSKKPKINVIERLLNLPLMQKITFAAVYDDYTPVSINTVMLYKVGSEWKIDFSESRINASRQLAEELIAEGERLSAMAREFLGKYGRTPLNLNEIIPSGSGYAGWTIEFSYIQSMGTVSPYLAGPALFSKRNIPEDVCQYLSSLHRGNVSCYQRRLDYHE